MSDESDDEPFAHLDVEYQVLTQALFERMFGGHKLLCSDVQSPSDSPYRILLPLQFEPIVNGTMLAYSEALYAEQYAGHFPEYPAWPVALIMHSLGRVAARLFHNSVEAEVPYDVVRAEVSADRLAFLSEPLSFRAFSDAASTSSSLYGFRCEALSNDDVIARLLVGFQSVCNRGDR